jgi:hypothetical protein
MNCNGIAVYSVLQSILECVIDPQYFQYPLYLYPQVSVETPLRTLVDVPYIQYSILISRALLNLNIVNMHNFCALKFLVMLQYER